MDFSLLAPYIVSLAVTLLYASVGKLSSGEPFNITKFAETFGVQMAALVGFALTSYFAGVDLSALVVALPTVIAAVVMKLYSYLQKKQAGKI